MARKNVARKNTPVTAYRDEIFNVDGPLVYFIGTPTNDLVKVGYTTVSFRSRFGRLAAQSPVAVMALGALRFSTVEGARRAEDAIHVMLTKGGRHSHGEWYRLPISGIRSIAGYFQNLGVTYVDASPVVSSVQEADMSEKDAYLASLAEPGTYRATVSW